MCSIFRSSKREFMRKRLTRTARILLEFKDAPPSHMPGDGTTLFLLFIGPAAAHFPALREWQSPAADLRPADTRRNNPTVAGNRGAHLVGIGKRQDGMGGAVSAR